MTRDGGAALLIFAALCAAGGAPARLTDGWPAARVEAQPLAANVQRVVEALDQLGSPLPRDTRARLRRAIERHDAVALQHELDSHVLIRVRLGRDGSIHGDLGPARAALQQVAYTPILIQILNAGGVLGALRIDSPQSGPPYAGVADLSMSRQRQRHLKVNENTAGVQDRFLHAELYTSQPMTPAVSGLEAEYALALIYSSEPGRKDVRLFLSLEGRPETRAEIPVTFDVRPAVPVRLRVRDERGRATTGRFTFTDRAGRVHPPQARRLAPDFFFQRHIYRRDGEIVLLPPGELTMEYGRGPEYRVGTRKVRIANGRSAELGVDLERWIDPAAAGYFSGDHHIHGAGCAHYTHPSEGVFAADMFRNVQGEGLNVGSVLTWGPCFDFQRQFFSPLPHRLSEPFTVIKYDLEVSGFGSQALGHVCLLNLKEQTYPGSGGSRDSGWPTWTTPVLRWAKSQKAVTGYAHSGSGLEVIPPAASRRLIAALDRNGDGSLSAAEAEAGLIPEPFAGADTDRSGTLDESELVRSHERAAERLPNLAIPEMNGVGAQEICVTVAQGLCDFISSMDTPRIAEWNCWYHLMNSGYALKTSGETDFPCMSGSRVGQGRSYVHLGKVERLDFADWCAGLARGRSYVSDGYAHALEFRVNGAPAGDEIRLAAPAEVIVEASVAFAGRQPVDAAHGGVVPAAGPKWIGDTVNRHEPLHDNRLTMPGELRRVEVVVNGVVAASAEVAADDSTHRLRFPIRIERSSWVAVRHFPQMHTNPVNVLIGGRPIRASRKSALWCVGVIEQLWRARRTAIAAHERDEAERTFQWAIEQYRARAAEAHPDT